MPSRGSPASLGPPLPHTCPPAVRGGRESEYAARTSVDKYPSDQDAHSAACPSTHCGARGGACGEEVGEVGRGDMSVNE